MATFKNGIELSLNYKPNYDALMNESEGEDITEKSIRSMYLESVSGSSCVRPASLIGQQLTPMDLDLLTSS